MVCNFIKACDYLKLEEVMNKKEHLPLLGVGPVIIAGQIITTIIGIVIFLNVDFELGVITLYS